MANGTIAFDTLSTSGQISGTAKSVDTDYLASGIKYHCTLNGNSFGILESFNNASATDNGNGDYTITNTNAFDNARPARVVHTHNTSDDGGSLVAGATRAGTLSSGRGDTAPTSLAYRFITYFGSSASENGEVVNLSFNYVIGAGDLA